MKQEESTWQHIDVAEQFIHPYYNAHTQLNDIMLLKVPPSITHFSTPPARTFHSLSSNPFSLTLPSHHPTGERLLACPGILY